ncbi:MAG: radical SAM protein, partial [Verrucomicrobiota bacterium]
MLLPATSPESLNTSTDSFGRRVDYLRISVTDQCNERCLYCRPASYRGWSPRPEHLTAREIIEVAQAAARLGFSHFRLTGGEPLLRPDLLE